MFAMSQPGWTAAWLGAALMRQGHTRFNGSHDNNSARVSAPSAASPSPLVRVSPRPSPRLARPLALALALCVADTALAIHTVASSALTLAQALAFVPWLRSLLAMAAADRRGARRRLPVLALHLAAAGVAVACLASKSVVLAWPDGSGARLEHAYRTYTVIGTVAAALGFALRGARLARLLGALEEHPARLMLASFGLTAVLGGFVLTLPVSVRRLDDASYIDGLFMATSAVCVTGLAVHDVAGTYTPVGQAVLLLLIQAGGLGIMVLSTFLVIAAGQRLGVRSAAMMAEATAAEGLASLRRTVSVIVLATLGIEAAGAIALYGAFSRHPGVGDGPESAAALAGAGSLVWAAVFHAVSAFCNAGFSLFRANLAPLAGDLAVNVTVSLLVVAGGLGFPVLAELGRRAAGHARRTRSPRMTLHARVVLATSALLLLSATLLLLVLEWSRSLAHLPWWQRLMAAVFQAVSARTAGFNTVDLALMQPASWLVLCAFMFVGASPGSTGGGIKTSTLAALTASLRALLRGDDAVRLFDRSLPDGVVQKAIGVTFLSGLLVSALAFLLRLTEDGDSLRLAFEVVSAFATVGYSTGITPELSPLGRLILTATMLIGRVGPITMALALAGRARSSAVRPVEEKVLVG
jgi:trk system potassium uptake protein TrkH